ncbi:Homeobox protein Hox-A2b [Liparis tanakae]|uniref:Homeobox protein Hox-A2b n=1 Tax=Liparis tanakae TaxID=230148 RepID=A0A4Z2IKX8_9TELE|nr:Homeobox protein Hox-A2b [Liparis tanakae]
MQCLCLWEDKEPDWTALDPIDELEVLKLRDSQTSPLFLVSLSNPLPHPKRTDGDAPLLLQLRTCVRTPSAHNQHEGSFPDKQEEMNYEFGRESGFINSQPSLAECLTSLAIPVGDAFQSSSIKSAELSQATLIPPPFEQTIPGLNPGIHSPHSRSKLPLQAASLPLEYPWMKEKKSIKRNQTAAAAATADSSPLYFSPQGKT